MTTTSPFFVGQIVVPNASNVDNFDSPAYRVTATREDAYDGTMLDLQPLDGGDVQHGWRASRFDAKTPEVGDRVRVTEDCYSHYAGWDCRFQREGTIVVRPDGRPGTGYSFAVKIADSQGAYDNGVFNIAVDQIEGVIGVSEPEQVEHEDPLEAFKALVLDKAMKAGRRTGLLHEILPVLAELGLTPKRKVRVTVEVEVDNDALTTTMLDAAETALALPAGAVVVTREVTA